MPNEEYSSKHRFEPVVYYCGIDKDLKPGASYGPVVRDVFLVECCVSGYGTIIINNVEFPITPRTCYFLLPGDSVTHVTAKDEPRTGCWCAIEGLHIENALKRAGISSSSPFAPPEVFDEINAHVEELYATRDENDLGADLRRTAHIYSILGSLLRVGGSTDKNVWVEKAIGYMETNYPSDISIAALASEVGLERTYFSTLFKTHTGSSPHEYLTYLRIRKAASLVKDDELSMSEIAETVGLDPKNFTRIFKREIGMTPREYKRKVSEDSELVDIYRRKRKIRAKYEL